MAISAEKSLKFMSRAYLKAVVADCRLLAGSQIRRQSCGRRTVVPDIFNSSSAQELTSWVSHGSILSA